MGSSFKKKLYEIPKSLKKKKCHSKNRKNWGRGVDPPTHHPEGFWDSALEKRHCGAVPFLGSVRSGCKKKLFLKKRRSGTNKRPCSFFFYPLVQGHICLCLCGVFWVPSYDWHWVPAVLQSPAMYGTHTGGGRHGGGVQHHQPAGHGDGVGQAPVADPGDAPRPVAHRPVAHQRHRQRDEPPCRCGKKQREFGDNFPITF